MQASGRTTGVCWTSTCRAATGPTHCLPARASSQGKWRGHVRRQRLCTAAGPCPPPPPPNCVCSCAACRPSPAVPTPPSPLGLWLPGFLLLSAEYPTLLLPPPSHPHAPPAAAAAGTAPLRCSRKATPGGTPPPACCSPLRRWLAATAPRGCPSTTTQVRIRSFVRYLWNIRPRHADRLTCTSHVNLHTRVYTPQPILPALPAVAAYNFYGFRGEMPFAEDPRRADFTGRCAAARQPSSPHTERVLRCAATSPPPCLDVAHPPPTAALPACLTPQASKAWSAPSSC